MQKKYALILVSLLMLPVVISAGSIAVYSEPSGAEIILNRIRTGHFTPDTIYNLPESKISVSLLHKECQFEELSVITSLDSLSKISFSRAKVFDPLTITGSKNGFGVLQLPVPPIDAPWLLNELIEDRNSVVLSSGVHHVQWDGGISYEPVDTFIEIPKGAIISPEIEFQRRYGRISLVTSPEQAAIYIDSTLWGIGKIRKPLTAGSHQLKVTAAGYIPVSRELLVFPSQNLRDSIVLVVSPDRDGDGFNDTVDLCPNQAGIYEGCPKIKKSAEMKRIGSHLWKTFTEAPFVIEFAPVSLQKRIPVMGAIPDSVQMKGDNGIQFPQITSLFNDGPALLNNYQGVQLCNKLWLSRGLLIGSIDVGYSVGGLKYKKPWTILMDSASGEYLKYDKSKSITPTLSIVTTCVQVGFQLRGDPFVFSFMTGYASEKITFDNISQVIDSSSKATKLVTEVYNNNFWNTTARVAIAFKKAPFVPELYAEMSFGPNRRKDAVTGWIDTRLGVIVPWWKVKS